MGRKRKKGGYYNEEFFFQKALKKDLPKQQVVEKELTDELFEKPSESHRNPIVKVKDILENRSPSDKEDGVKAEDKEELAIESQSTIVQGEKESVDQEKEDEKINRESSSKSNEKPIEDLIPQLEDKIANRDIIYDEGVNGEVNERELGKEEVMLHINDENEIQADEQDNNNHDHDASINFDQSITDDDEENEEGIVNSINHNEDKREIPVKEVIEKEDDKLNTIKKESIEDKEERTFENEEPILQVSNELSNEENLNNNNNIQQINDINNNAQESSLLINESKGDLKEEIAVIPIEAKEINHCKEQNNNTEEKEVISELKEDKEFMVDQHLTQNEDKLINDHMFSIKPSPMVSTENNLEDKLPQNNHLHSVDNNVNEDIRPIIPSRLKNKNRRKLNGNYKDNHNNNANSIPIQNEVLLTSNDLPTATRNGKSHSMVIEDNYSNSITFTEKRNTQLFREKEAIHQECVDNYRNTEYQSTFSTNILDRQKTSIASNVPVIRPPPEIKDDCCIII